MHFVDQWKLALSLFPSKQKPQPYSIPRKLLDFSITSLYYTGLGFHILNPFLSSPNLLIKPRHFVPFFLFKLKTTTLLCTRETRLRDLLKPLLYYIALGFHIFNLFVSSPNILTKHHFVLFFSLFQA